jgi:hypothetical protein
MDKALSPFSAISARMRKSWVRAEVVQISSLRVFAASREINAHIPRALTQGCWTHAKPRRREEGKTDRFSATPFLPQRGRGTACGGGARATASVVVPPLPLVAAPPSASPPPPRYGEELV